MRKCCVYSLHFLNKLSSKVKHMPKVSPIYFFSKLPVCNATLLTKIHCRCCTIIIVLKLVFSLLHCIDDCLRDKIKLIFLYQRSAKLGGIVRIPNSPFPFSVLPSTLSPPLHFHPHHLFPLLIPAPLLFPSLEFDTYER